MIAGVDHAPVLRRGDISLTGIFFELDREVGPAGSLQWLKLWSIDRRITTEVMGRIQRSITLDDVAQPEPRFGIAFDFMLDSSDRFAALQNLISSVLKRAAASRRVELDSDDLPKAAVFQPRISRLEIDANWALKIGEIVQLVFRSPGTQTRIPFEGKVSKVARAPVAGAASYHVEVELSAPGVRVGASSSQASISESVDLIFNVLLDEAETHRKDRSSRKESLVGQLSRISITSLFSLFEQDRVSGEMRLTRDEERIHIYVQSGQIVDAELEGSDSSPRDVLRSVITSREGTFDFTPEEIDRPDRVGMSTTSLILELAREHDELERDGGREPSGDVVVDFGVE